MTPELPHDQRRPVPTPYYQDDAVTLHIGDALDVLSRMPDASIGCVTTSPPCWGMRDYLADIRKNGPSSDGSPAEVQSSPVHGIATWTGGDPTCQHTLGTTPHQRRTPKTRPTKRTHPAQKHCRKCGAACHDRQYGLETTPDEYVDRLRQVGSELKRVLIPQGTLWLNLRDSYSYHWNGTGRTRPHDSDHAHPPSVFAAPHKSLLGLPWRVAFALQDDGWIIRNAIVWHKPNAIPDPATDRLSSRYELLFLLVKQPNYFFDIKQIREPYSRNRPLARKTHHGGTKTNTVKSTWQPRGQGKNPGDVWSLSTRPLTEAHYAPFPVDVPLRCIRAGCPPAAVVLDPFSGAGTTGIAAHRLDHPYQGIDLRADYHDLFLDRLLQQAQPSAGQRNEETPDREAA